MISYPCAKINIGLNVIEKREDGFHNIESIFYPIPLVDILEINYSSHFNFESNGLKILGGNGNNLIVRAFKLLKEKQKIGNVSIFLYKQIPMGAGLGGGSSDAAFTLTMLNSLFELQLSTKELEIYAIELGSDCPFFIDCTPKYVTGTGDKMESININLSNYFIYLINPELHVGTAKAYSSISEKKTDSFLLSDIKNGIIEWENNIKNDFESSIFKQHPKLANIKQKLYDLGATYASMSGSGSTIYGLFKEEPKKINMYPYEKLLRLI